MRSFTDTDLENCLPALRRFALALTRNGSEADDLVQDTVERALARAEMFAHGTNLRAWLFTICRNQFLSGRRKHASAGEHVPLDDVHAGIPTAPNQEGRMLMRDLERGFAALSQSDRDVITTVAIGGMPYDAAARRMRVEVGTVKSRLSRARTRLDAAMQYRAPAKSAA